MPKLNNLLPPTKYRLLRVIAILLAVFYALLGLGRLMGAANDGHLFGLFLGMFFCLFAVSTWRLRYWAFQLTCQCYFVFRFFRRLDSFHYMALSLGGIRVFILCSGDSYYSIFVL
jgi:hypothetical protein